MGFAWRRADEQQGGGCEGEKSLCTKEVEEGLHTGKEDSLTKASKTSGRLKLTP